MDDKTILFHIQSVMRQRDRAYQILDRAIQLICDAELMVGSNEDPRKWGKKEIEEFLWNDGEWE